MAEIRWIRYLLQPGCLRIFEPAADPSRIQLLNRKAAGDEIVLVQRRADGGQPPGAHFVIGVAKHDRFAAREKCADIARMGAAGAVGGIYNLDGRQTAAMLFDDFHGLVAGAVIRDNHFPGLIPNLTAERVQLGTDGLGRVQTRDNNA